MELQEDYKLIADLNADIIAISTDDLSGASYVADGLRLDFPILYDPEADVVRGYGVYDLLDDGMAAPATFILDRKGQIRWQYVGSNIYDRASNREMISQLRELPEG